MARFRPPRDIPDIGPTGPLQARFKAWLRSTLVEIAEDMAALGRDSSDTLIAQETIDVDVPSLRRVTPPVGGMGVRLPPPSAENAGKSVRLMIEAPVGDLTVISRPGRGDDGKVFQPTVNGEPRATFSVSGLVTFTSNGVNDWKTDAEFPAESPTVANAEEEQAGIDATYHLAVAHPDLPNARVADDSTEIAVDNTSPGLVSWFLNTASVAFSKLNNLAGLSVLGRAASTTGVMAAITATSAKQVLRNAGANLHWEYPVSVGSPFVWVFDGVDDRADYGDVLDMDRTTARSIFFWYATTSTAGPCVIGKQATSTSAGWRFCVSNSTLDWILRGSSQQLQAGLTTPAPLDGSMHLLGMTYTGSSNATGVQFYLDTVNVAKTVGTNNLTSESTQNASSLLIGRRGTDAHFTGGIQHVSVWNRVLTQGEVDQLSDGGAPADLASLSFFSDCIFWSKFDGTDTTGASGIADHSASNFDGTAQGGLAPSGGDEQVHTFVEGGGVDLSVLENVCTVTREAITGAVSASAGSNATQFAGIRDNGSLETARGFLNLVSSTSVTLTGTQDAGNDEIEITAQRAALTGFAAASANSNATTSAEPIVTYSASANMSAERVTTSSTSITVSTSVASQIEFQRAALTGDVTASANSNATTIANDAVTNAKMANVTSPSLKGRTTASTGDPEDLTLVNSTSNTWNTSTGGSISVERAALTGDVTATANSNATTIANSAVTLAKMANLAAGTVIGRQVDASTGVPVALTGAEQAENFRRATVQTVSGVTGDTTIAVNDDTTVIVIESTADIRVQAFTGTFGQGREIVVEHIRTSGTGIVRFQHQAALGAGTVDLLLPGNVDYELGHRAVITMRLRTVFMRFQTASDQLRPFNIASVASNRGIAWEERVAFTASGATGTLIDVTIWNAAAPFALRILRAELRVSVAGGTASALRTASGGGGSVVLPDVAAATQTFDTSATGVFRDSAAATATVASGGSLFFNVDRAVTGEIVLTCVRT